MGNPHKSLILRLEWMPRHSTPTVCLNNCLGKSEIYIYCKNATFETFLSGQWIERFRKDGFRGRILSRYHDSLHWIAFMQFKLGVPLEYAGSGGGERTICVIDRRANSSSFGKSHHFRVDGFSAKTRTILEFE